MALDNVWLHEGDHLRSLTDGATRPATGGTEQPSMLLGSSAGTGTSFTAWNAECINDGSKPGAANLGLGLHRTYSGGSIVNNFMNTSAAGDVANGVASMWSCKPNLDTVNSGGLDSTFTQFFNSIPAGHRAWLMMWHEPWDDAFNWNTYRSAQARVWNLLQNSDADTSLIKWGILGTGWDFIQGRAQTNFFPASGEYDFVGVDEYDFYRNLRVLPESPRGRNKHRKAGGGGMFGATVAFANSVDKPVVVGEFGMHPDPENLTGLGNNWEGVPSKPKRLMDVLDYFVENNVEAAAYFHSPNGDDGPWWLSCVHNFSSPQDLSTPDPASVEMWRNYLALYGKQE